jgi:hypothetical protein
VKNEWSAGVVNRAAQKDSAVTKRFALHAAHAYILKRVTVFRAQVRNGKLVLDEPTDLPEGTSVELVYPDGEDDIPADERSAFEAALARGMEQARRGEGVPASDVLAHLRRI